MRRSVVTGIAGSVLAASLICGFARGASAAERKFRNCETLNNVYPHGVGLPGAVDRVSGSKNRVTNFAKKAGVYRAQSKNLDRDGDGIACEKE
jgi:Excalibur calcium-binding domain